jgi:hypothetical protein
LEKAVNLREFYYRLRQAKAYGDLAVQQLIGSLAGGAGMLTIVGDLRGVLYKGPEHPITNISPRKRLRLGLLSRRSVTDAGVAFLVDDFDNGGTDISTFNFHDCGTGSTAEATSQTALVTPYGGSRASGTRSQPSANQFRSVGTISFTGTASIVEHGLFSASTVGTLWDRSLFTSIGVVNLDSIEFTYTLTCSSGG